MPEDRGAILQKREGGEAGCTFPPTLLPKQIWRSVLQAPTFPPSLPFYPFKLLYPSPSLGRASGPREGDLRGWVEKTQPIQQIRPIFDFTSKNPSEPEAPPTRGNWHLRSDWTPLRTPVIPSREGTMDASSPRIGFGQTGDLSFCMEIHRDRRSLLQERGEWGEAWRLCGRHSLHNKHHKPTNFHHQKFFMPIGPEHLHFEFILQYWQVKNKSPRS